MGMNIHLECNIRSFNRESIIYLWDRTTVNCLTNRNILLVPGSSVQLDQNLELEWINFLPDLTTPGLRSDLTFGP